MSDNNFPLTAAADLDSRYTVMELHCGCIIRRPSREGDNYLLPCKAHGRERLDIKAAPAGESPQGAGPAQTPRCPYPICPKCGSSRVTVNFSAWDGEGISARCREDLCEWTAKDASEFFPSAAPPPVIFMHPEGYQIFPDPPLPTHVWCECGHISGHHSSKLPYPCATGGNSGCDKKCIAFKAITPGDDEFFCENCKKVKPLDEKYPNCEDADVCNECAKDQIGEKP